MMKTKIIKIVVPIILGLAVLAVIVLGIILGFKLFGKTCDSLTPLALKKFEIAGGVRPIKGDKCEISKNSYLLRLFYNSSDEAETAKTGLELATPGDRDEIEDLDWITNDGASSVFWTNKKKLGILVIPDEDTKKAVEKELDKAFKKLE
ncbi:hypothetical protein KJ841_01515 [Patescibacteria group bacterium]|nr:hypothetical protein [Patescibacteria group bacterium]